MKNTPERAVIRVVIATGISSVVTQLLAIREFLAQVHGNEFVITMILFSWLLLGGFGTRLAKITTPRLWPATARRLGVLSFLLAVFPVLLLFSIRFFRQWAFLQGASIGFYATLAYVFFSLAPYALLVGYSLPFALLVLDPLSRTVTGVRIYVFDNIGDVLGGVIFSFILINWCSPIQSAAVSGIVLAIPAFFLFFSTQGGRPSAVIGCVLVAVTLALGLVYEKNTLQTGTGKLAHYKESKFGRIEVFRDVDQVTVFSDGVPITGSNDPVVAEEAVHYAMSQIIRPRHVLLVSARGGMVDELAKYGDLRIDYVELNPESSDVLFRFNLLESIKGLRVIHQDGRAYLANSKTAYDAIIVSLPEPETFQVNRFFTESFFRLAADRLTENGVLTFSVEGYENYLGEIQRQKVSILYNTVSMHFPHVLMLPAGRIIFLCSRSALTTSIPERLLEKGIETRYIQHYYRGNITRERIDGLAGLLDGSAPSNSDMHPHLIRIMFNQWFDKFSSSPRGLLTTVCIGCLLYLFLIPRQEFTLFSTGFVSMGFEILVIFAFQIFYGYIYSRIGIIVTVFLAGLLPGAWLGKKAAAFGFRALQVFDLAIVLLLAGFCMVVCRGEGLPAEIVFFGFGLVVSLLCGAQFPVALSMGKDGKTAAIGAFSSDLIGAAFGTLLTSVVLIPYAGIDAAIWALMGIKLLSILLMEKRNG